MKDRNAFVSLPAVVLVVLVLVAGLSQRGDAMSDALHAVLGDIHGTFSNDLSRLTAWAKNGHPAPDNPVFSLETTEAAIDGLDSDERDAVLSWLRGNGRSQLHSVGASDADIGSPLAGVDAASAVATPNPWRAIPLATTSLDTATVGNLQILGSFAAVKKDGTAMIACFSFKNIDPRVAKRLALDRVGEFSPNIEIRSFNSMAMWQGNGGVPTRSYLDGCIQKDLPTAALPLL